MANKAVYDKCAGAKSKCADVYDKSVRSVEAQNKSINAQKERVLSIDSQDDETKSADAQDKDAKSADGLADSQDKDAKCADAQDECIKLAVFDLDGTCLDGSSTVRLVLYLVHKWQLKIPTGLLIAMWAFAYKFKLPQNEAWVRGKVFRAFEGKPQKEVDNYLYAFADKVVNKLWRDAAQQEIDKMRKEGYTVLIVSASFEPIVKRMCELHNISYQVSTRMKIDKKKCYLNKVDGFPIEGNGKVLALRSFADSCFGAHKWVCEHAYADHHSDISLLEHASYPHAVNPDATLRRYAKNNNWEILDWEEK